MWKFMELIYDSAYFLVRRLKELYYFDGRD
jgi:hypothetical protein